jgi:hypothetical protein
MSAAFDAMTAMELREHRGTDPAKEVRRFVSVRCLLAVTPFGYESLRPG